jgi:hypothetical protein
MPLVSEFHGIRIYLYWDDHSPPHFHAEFGEHAILVDIEEGIVIKGVFPFRQLKLVLAWCELHRGELLADWLSAAGLGEISRIEPLR